MAQRGDEMFDDNFKIRYSTIPIAMSENDGSLPTKLHNHNEFEILLVMEGSCTVSIANKEYNVKSGDMIFVNPMEVHRIIANRNEKYLHRCICFDVSLIMNERISNDLVSECTCIIPHISGNTLHGKYLKSLFNEIIDALNRGDKTVSMDVTAYITLIFSYLIKNSLLDNKRIAPKQSEFCAAVTGYLKKNYGKNLTSKDMAEVCFLNHSYFCRKFKENFGISFSQYLNIYRISMARKMLEENSGSIAEIAEKCGFETPAYFSKCFKTHIGILPNEYKKSKNSL